MKDVTIEATTSYPPLQYALKGDKSVGLQDSNTFTGLNAGSYSIKLKDSEGNIKLKSFEISITIDSISIHDQYDILPIDVKKISYKNNTKIIYK